MPRLATLLLLITLTVAFCAGEGEDLTTLSTKRPRFTRRSTTPTPTTTVSESMKTNKITKASIPNDSESFTTIETSVVTGAAKITVEIVTKKSLHVRNCGERIGDDVPFVAVLVHTNPNDKKSTKQRKTLSKGVLIAENFVLATVSSIYHSEPFWTVSSVRLGDFPTWNKFAKRDKNDSMEIEVDEIFYHKQKDLALIKLKHAVPFSDVIRPACLPQSDGYNFKTLLTHLCKRARKGPADVSLESAAPLASFDCKQFFARRHMTVTQQEFCVWDESDDDCTGDIGSPLFTIHNGRLFVLGLRSYLESDDEISDSDQYPGVYVKIGAHLDWISTVMSLAEKDDKTTKSGGI